MNQNNNHKPAATINVPGCMIMVRGERTRFHVERHQTKLNKNRFDAGIDLYPAPDGVLNVTPYGSWTKIMIPTHLHMIIPPGSYGLLLARSSTIDKLHGGEVISSVIDAGYTGEIMMRVRCLTADQDRVVDAVRTYAKMELALAQIIISSFYLPVFRDWNEQAVSSLGGRQADGYGSTDGLKDSKIVTLPANRIIT